MVSPKASQKAKEWVNKKVPYWDSRKELGWDQHWAAEIVMQDSEKD